MNFTFPGAMDQYFESWQSFTGGYFRLIQEQPLFFRSWGLWLERYLDAKKTADRFLEEMWRNLGLPPLEEVIRLHQRINHLEARIAGQACGGNEDTSWSPEQINQALRSSPQSPPKRRAKRVRRRANSPAE